MSGILTVAFTVACRSQLPKLMHSAQLVDGNGKLGMCESLTELTGPGLGGVLAGALATRAGLRPTLWICALGMWSAALFVVFSPLRSLRDVPVRRVATG
ncbi:hypothetical protein [Streptomyces benahoarensis]|uniref:Uncharacterized protein n=1 Tax=Streptomyces benahoarensis TaxID=2595054 RepID=A0A553XV77_9ACTN|nr:hypothetical protein [Streptomyces benahoarensis]TSB13085.1 hypothetical protein FNJ62_29915 [Streptomyces benahoarensis]TSB20855.1 hypothetical protein FNZ23_28745 [Streptomyces benahoarensis]